MHPHAAHSPISGGVRKLCVPFNLDSLPEHRFRICCSFTHSSIQFCDNLLRISLQIHCHYFQLGTFRRQPCRCNLSRHIGKINIQLKFFHNCIAYFEILCDGSCLFQSIECNELIRNNPAKVFINR